MTKELEALKDLCEFVNYCDEANEDVGVIEQALQRLEQIDNANPSKAVECILDIKSNYKFYAHNNRTIDYQCSVIIQSLLKSQKQEKENNKMKKLLLELSDISPDNVDCIYQCNYILNMILKANISVEINKSCENNLKIIKRL